jgi:hypothetical protein
MVKCGVLFEVRTELNIIWTRFGFSDGAVACDNLAMPARIQIGTCINCILLYVSHFIIMLERTAIMCNITPLGRCSMSVVHLELCYGLSAGLSVE